MTNTLVYFDLRGRAEAMRMMMTDNNIKYEEKLVDFKDWPELKPTIKPFGQLPKMTFSDGLVLCQSYAIMRHLARIHGLYGETEHEAARIDMINDGQEDFRMKYVKLIYQNYDDGKAAYIKDLPTHLQPFENLLKENGGGFLVGKKVSFVDYNVYDLLDLHCILSPGCLDGFPLLTAFYKMMTSRPNLAPYVSTDAFKNKQVNGNKNK